jgi:ribose transport system ATP-binding protein
VLSELAISLAEGEIHGLVGANGSGKSTFIKILAGYQPADPGGRIAVRGTVFGDSIDPKRIEECGVRFIHQDLGLVQGLSIADNLALDARLSLRRIRRKRYLRECADRLRAFGLRFGPDELLGDLALAEQVMVALVRMVNNGNGDASLLVVDEATSGLPHEEAERVLQVMRTAADKGVGILFVSHRLDEVLRVCDQITVLRDGVVVAAGPAEGYSVQSLSQRMFGVGAALTVRESREVRAWDSSVRLDVRGLTSKTIKDLSFSVAEGEILGITGLLNCGSSEVGQVLFGAEAARGGTVSLAGRPLDMSALTPVRSIRRGIVYVPPSRDLSLIKSLTVRENLVLAEPKAHWHGLRIRNVDETSEVMELLQRFGVVPAFPESLLRILSGGNQQKVALAKWLRTKPVLLILDEPTRGVDAAARSQIHDILKTVACSGVSILILTSEQDDVAMLCDRALILYDGTLIEELSGIDLEPSSVATHIASVSV